MEWLWPQMRGIYTLVKLATPIVRWLVSCSGTPQCHWTWDKSFHTRCYLTSCLPTFKPTMNKMSRNLPLLIKDLKGAHTTQEFFNQQAATQRQHFQMSSGKSTHNTTHTASSAPHNWSTASIHSEVQLPLWSRWTQCLGGMQNTNKMEILYAPL